MELRKAERTQLLRLADKVDWLVEEYRQVACSCGASDTKGGHGAGCGAGHPRALAVRDEVRRLRMVVEAARAPLTAHEVYALRRAIMHLRLRDAVPGEPLASALEKLAGINGIVRS